jgi:hypothetical protein
LAASTESGKEPARQRTSRRVGLLLAAVLPPAARKRAFAEAAILGEWATIVGPELAARCTPLALRGAVGGGATLELAVRGGAALELQHAAPQLVERINGHLGWRAVARLVLRQRPPPARTPEPPPPTPPDPALERVLAAELEALEAPELAEALRGLGRILLGRRGGRR